MKLYDFLEHAWRLQGAGRNHGMAGLASRDERNAPDWVGPETFKRLEALAADTSDQELRADIEGVIAWARAYNERGGYA